MQEYTADELAEDSGDEKRLEKAERAAELKAAKRRKKKASSAQSSRSRCARASPALVLSMMTVVACTAGRITVDAALHV